MSFMSLFVEYGDWYVVETSNGTEIVPCDVAGNNADLESIATYCESAPRSFERKTGYCARYSAPGYLDCTGWCGPYETEQEAIEECKEVYGDDDDTESAEV